MKKVNGINELVTKGIPTERTGSRFLSCCLYSQAIATIRLWQLKICTYWFSHACYMPRLSRM